MLGQQAKLAQSDAKEAVYAGRTPLWYQEDAAGIPQPYSVGGPAMEANVGGKGVGSFQYFAGLLGGRRVVDDQLDAFMFGQVANDFRVDPRNRSELSGPIFAVVRPREPRGGGRDR